MQWNYFNCPLYWGLYWNLPPFVAPCQVLLRYIDIWRLSCGVFFQKQAKSVIVTTSFKSSSKSDSGLCSVSHENTCKCLWNFKSNAVLYLKTILNLLSLFIFSNFTLGYHYFKTILVFPLVFLDIIREYIFRQKASDIKVL